MEVMDSSSNVGYGKPPRHCRFRKGASGNRKGRPKGRRNIATILEEILREKIVVNENGVRKTVTKLDAALKQLVNKATSGDLIAVRQLILLAGSTEQHTVEPETKKLSDVDLKIMQRVLRRKGTCAKGETGEHH